MLKALFIVFTYSFCSIGLCDYKKEFSNLLEKDRVKYIQLVEEADALNKEIKIFSAFIKLEEAESIFSEGPSLKFREGTFYATIGYESEARRCFEEVLKIVPLDYDTMESIAELSYRQQKWHRCIKEIEAFRAAHPRKTSIYPLLSFKQLICLQKIGDHKQFHFYLERFKKQFSYMDDTPMFYYLRALDAALENDQDRALQHIARAWRVFKIPGLHKTWSDALVHAGYLPEHKLSMKIAKVYSYVPFTL